MEVAGLAFKTIEEVWRQRRDSVLSKSRQHESVSSSRAAFVNTHNALYPVISLYALNKAATGALEQRTLRAAGKVSLRDEADFKELQGLAQKYKDILGKILNDRIEMMTEGGDNLPARKQGLKGFATEVLNSLKILGDDQFGQDASRQRVLAVLEYSFKKPDIFLIQ